MATHTIVGEPSLASPAPVGVSNAVLNAGRVSTPPTQVTTPPPVTNKPATSSQQSSTSILLGGDSNNNNGSNGGEEFSTFTLHGDYEFDFQWPIMTEDSNQSSEMVGGGGNASANHNSSMQTQQLNSSPVQPNIAATWGVEDVTGMASGGGEDGMTGHGNNATNIAATSGVTLSGTNSATSSNSSGSGGGRLRILLTNNTNTKQENKILKGN